MKTLHLAYVALLFPAIVFGPAPAHAELVQYSYTGNSFTDVSRNSDYSTSMSVTGFFTVPSVLDCSSTCDLLALFTPRQNLTWSFSDGLSTLTDSSTPASNRPDHFIVTTDPTGMVIETWDILLSGDGPTAGCHGLQDCFITTQNDAVIDQGEYVGPAGAGTFRFDASVSGDPGSWNCQIVGSAARCGTAQVDEPRELALVLAAVLAAWISVARRAATSRSRLLAQQCSRARRV